MARPPTRTARRGANAIEFALILPVLITMMAGIMEYGWYFSQMVALSAATNDAARAGATTPEDSDDTPEQVAEHALAVALVNNGYQGTVYTEIYREGTAPYQALHVGVVLPYSSLTGLVPAPEKITSRQIWRLEDQPG